MIRSYSSQRRQRLVPAYMVCHMQTCAHLSRCSARKGVIFCVTVPMTTLGGSPRSRRRFCRSGLVYALQTSRLTVTSRAKLALYSSAGNRKRSCGAVLCGE